MAPRRSTKLWLVAAVVGAIVPTIVPSVAPGTGADASAAADPSVAEVAQVDQAGSGAGSQRIGGVDVAPIPQAAVSAAAQGQRPPHPRSPQEIAAKERANRGEVEHSTMPAVVERPGSGGTQAPDTPAATPTPAAPPPPGRPGDKLTPTPAAHWGAAPQQALATTSLAPFTVIGPTISFDGTNKLVSGGEPPDLSIAAGPNDLVIAENTDILVYTKSGTSQGRQNLASAAGPPNALVMNADRPYDPEVVYDPYIGRFWLVFATESDIGSRSNFHLALSKTSNAFEGWKVFSFDARVDASTTSSNWCDFPRIGFDAQAIYITCNMYTFPSVPPDGSNPPFQYSKIRVMGKSQLLNDTCCHWFDLLDSKTITLQPARMYGAQAADGEFLIGAQGQGLGGKGLDIWHITNPLALSITREKRSIGVASFGVPPGARQLGSSVPLDTGTPQLLFATWRRDPINGKAYLSTGHTVSCPSSISGGGACAGFEELDLSAFPTMSVVNDWALGFANSDVYYPAADTNAAGLRALVYTQSSASTYAGAKFAGVAPASECTSCISFTNTLQNGKGPHVECATPNPMCLPATPAPANRWGDYQGVSPDPNGSGLWMHGEYAADTLADWDARVGLTGSDGPATNDDFVASAPRGAIALSGPLPRHDFENTTNATIQKNEQVSFGAGVCASTSRTVSKTVWYRYTAPFSGNINVDTFDPELHNVDTTIAVYADGSNGTIDQLSLLGCNDDAAGHGLQSRVAFQVEKNKIYHIQVGSFSTAAGGALAVNLNPGLAVSPSTVSAGQEVSVAWNNVGNPTGKEVFVLFTPDGTDFENQFEARFLTNCSLFPSTTGTPSGSCSLPLQSGLTPGTYEIRLFRDNTLQDRLSTSDTFTIQAPTVAQATLTASRTSLAAGDTLTATWSGIDSPRSTDWIGLYRPGADNKERLVWEYVSCSHTPGDARAAGSCPLTLPTSLTAGEYELRLYGDDSFDPVLATSSPISVHARLEVSPSSVRAGDSVTVTWSGIASPSPTDWLGVYELGAQDSAFVLRVYVSCGSTPDAAHASGSCVINLPHSLREANYEVRLFASGGFDREAVSNAFIVTRGRPGVDANQ